MKRILFPALLVFVLSLVSVPGHGSPPKDTCYFFVEYYLDDYYFSYYMLAKTDQTFVTNMDETGFWGLVNPGSLMYFQFWPEWWDFPRLFLSGTKKMGWGLLLDSSTGLSYPFVYAFKKVKLANCNFPPPEGER
jgi:hypothetical protein